MTTNSILYYHQIHFDFINTNTPLHNETIIIDKYTKKNFPNIEYTLWNLIDAKKFVDQYYPIFNTIFSYDTNFNIIKCDFFRYLLMYHFGGIYTDLDFISIRPFDDFLELLKKKHISFYPNDINDPSIILSDEWLNSSSFTNTLHNGILISLKKKHPFWLKLLFEIYNDLFVDKFQISNNNDVYTLSGPKKLNTFYNENINFYKDVCILPYFYFCPYISIENKKNVIFNHAMIDHKQQPSNELKWVFFNINDHDNLHTFCPNSFFVCVHLNTGSMWK